MEKSAEKNWTPDPISPPAGGPEAAQGEAQDRTGERDAGRGALCADDAGSSPGGVAGVPLRDMQARPAQREAGEQVLSLKRWLGRTPGARGSWCEMTAALYCAVVAAVVDWL